VVALVFVVTASTIPASADGVGNKIIGDSIIHAGQEYTFTIAGYNQDSPGRYNGEQKYIPHYTYAFIHSATNTKSYEYWYKAMSIPIYTHSITPTKPGVIEILTDFDLEIYSYDDGTGWWLPDDNWTSDTVTKKVQVQGKVKFNANKGKVKIKSKWYTYGKKYGKLPKPTRKGYKFLGWYTKKSGGKKVKSSTIYQATKATISIYAHWKKK
jgi:uncharacterized repeat protein (TIGR02543 family)